MAGLVALGAMGERISRFIEGGDRFVLGQISVAGEGMGMGAGFTAGGLLPAARIAEIARVPGVAVVQPQVMLPISTSTSHFLTLTQELRDGRGSRRAPRQSPLPSPCRSASGRPLAAGDRKVAVVGSDFAASRKLTVGADPARRRAGVHGGGHSRQDAHRARPLRHGAPRRRPRPVAAPRPAALPGLRLGRADARRSQLGRGGGMAGRRGPRRRSRGGSRPP